MQEIYFDNSATTKPLPEVVRAVVEHMERRFGNPSSLHRKGVEAERTVTRAREAVAGILGVQPGEVIFTSGGTEANNLALKGAAQALKKRGRHVITTAIEHPAVTKVCRQLEEEGFEVTYLPVDREGVINPRDLERELRPDTILVSTMHVNNEIGSVQPLEELAGIIRRARDGGRLPLWHVDAVQSLGRLPLKPPAAGIDMVSVSAHKIHGPKGVGALYVAAGTPLRPLLAGGGQEGNLRSGTENVPGIAGFGVAAAALKKRGGEAAGHMAALRRVLVEEVLAEIPGARLNGPPPGSGRAAPHIVNLSFPRIRGEVLAHWLEGEGVYVSTGSACSSRHAGEQVVLKALGLSEQEREGSIRISFCPFNTMDEVRAAVKKLKAGVKELQNFAGRR